MLPRAALPTLAVLCAAALLPRQDPAGEAESAREERVLVRFPDQAVAIDAWMEEHGWETQRGDPKRFEVGGGRLRMRSEGDSVAIGTERGFPIDPRELPVLRARFRVLALPTGTDLSKKEGDDAAFRLFVAFDRDHGFFHPPHTIAYAWAEDTEPGTVVQSAHFANLRYLVVGRGEPEEGEWTTLERDLLADYRRVFPGEAEPVPDLEGILLKCDANNTGTSARSEVAWVKLLAPGE